MKILSLLPILFIPYLFPSSQTLHSSKVAFESIPVDTIHLQWDYRYHMEEAAASPPLVIQLSKERHTLLAIPPGGTQTHASIGQGQETLVEANFFCCDPYYVNVSQWKSGEYWANMIACHGGGSRKIEIKR